jgi:hypothetical protein
MGIAGVELRQSQTSFARSSGLCPGEGRIGEEATFNRSGEIKVTEESTFVCSTMDIGKVELAQSSSGMSEALEAQLWQWAHPWR